MVHGNLGIQQGHRHAQLPHRALAQAASGPASPAPASSSWKAATPPPPSPTSNAAATSPSTAKTGPKAASPAARLDGGIMYAGANPRGMQGYAVGR